MLQEGTRCQETDSASGFSVEGVAAGRPTPGSQDTEQTVVHFHNKTLHPNSPKISSNSKFSKFDRRVNDNKENKINKINNNKKINQETKTPKQRRVKENLRGPTELIIQAKNKTRQPRGDKQNLGDQDLGIKIRPKQRSCGNRSGKNNYVGRAGVVSNQGEIKEYKQKKHKTNFSHEFLPREVNEVAMLESVISPAPFVRTKVQGKEIYAKGLIDTGNSSKNSLISEEFFNLCGGNFYILNKLG